MRVFFYGLFMDQRLLASKGVVPSEINVGFVDGYVLRIGDRATLAPRPEGRAYGVMMDIAPKDAEALYSEESVADYLPEPVIVELADGRRFEATCFNLPGDNVTGSNRNYAESLLDVATRMGFPDSYLAQIRQAGR